MLFTGGENIYFDTATMILVLFTLGRYLEASGRAKAVRNVAPLLEAERQWATVIENGKEIRSSISKMKVGMNIRVRPGERIPVDGIVLEGFSSADESILTGENRAVRQSEGDLVLAGSINQKGSLLVECRNLGSATQWGLICQSVRESLSHPSSIQRLADHVASIFVPIVLGIAVLTIIYWQSLVPLNQALLNGLAVLVVACPCALGLAAPLATALGLGQFLQRGCIIRGGEVQETLAQIRKIAFDKTGTLTKGATSVIEIENFFLRSIVVFNLDDAGCTFCQCTSFVECNFPDLCKCFLNFPSANDTTTLKELSQS
jgi:Cu2+-exporting ATPase